MIYRKFLNYRSCINRCATIFKFDDIPAMRPDQSKQKIMSRIGVNSTYSWYNHYYRGQSECGKPSEEQFFTPLPSQVMKPRIPQRFQINEELQRRFAIIRKQENMRSLKNPRIRNNQTKKPGSKGKSAARLFSLMFRGSPVGVISQVVFTLFNILGSAKSLNYPLMPQLEVRRRWSDLRVYAPFVDKPLVLSLVRLGMLFSWWLSKSKEKKSPIKEQDVPVKKSSNAIRTQQKSFQSPLMAKMFGNCGSVYMKS